MWGEKSISINEVFDFLCGHIQLHHCAVFLDNFCCCATPDAVQDIIRVVAVVHALHPERDPQVSLCCDTRVPTSTNVSETITPNFLETLFSDSAQRRARTCIVIFTLIDRKRSTPAWEAKIASQMSWKFDGISNFNAVFLASAAMLYTKSRESVAKTNQSL